MLYFDWEIAFLNYIDLLDLVLILYPYAGGSLTGKRSDIWSVSIWILDFVFHFKVSQTGNKSLFTGALNECDCNNFY